MRQSDAPRTSRPPYHIVRRVSIICVCVGRVGFCGGGYFAIAQYAFLRRLFRYRSIRLFEAAISLSLNTPFEAAISLSLNTPPLARYVLGYALRAYARRLGG